MGAALQVRPNDRLRGNGTIAPSLCDLYGRFRLVGWLSTLQRCDDVGSQMLSQSLAMRRYELIRGNIAPEVGTNVKAAGVARD
jgi:hypothetical protein